MKVYISKPRDHWISPYTILEHIFFWTDWSKCARDRKYNYVYDDENYVDHPKWVDEWSDKLVPISEGIRWVWDKIHPPIEYVKIDYWDTWSMDYTLSPIILPMLKQLKATKHGSGYVDLEDVPEHLRYTETEDWNEQQTFEFYREENEQNIKCDVHVRYDWLLDELIWTFEQLNDDDKGEGPFWIERGEIDFDDHPEDEGKKVKPLRWKKESVVNWEGLRAHQERVQNGLRLFGKYYSTLWD